MVPMEQQAKIRRAHIIREIVEVLLLVAIIAIAIKISLDAYSIPRKTMEPGLKQGQLVMVNKLAYLFASPQRGDVVVAYNPIDTKQQVIARVIGIPGDTLVIDTTSVTINDHLLTEPYITQAQNPNAGTWVLGKDQFYLMGDNRPYSCDSRIWGMVDHQLILGKVIFVYFPLNQIHGVNTYASAFNSIPARTAPAKSSQPDPQTCKSN